MDEKARKIKDEAELNKTISESQAEELKQKIYDEYITRAKNRIEKNIAIDKKRAEEKWIKYSAKVQASKEKLQNDFSENKDKWTEEIFEKTVG